ncbi:hypothetical protein FJTKL_02066 [Diaporthe vaccinii]|uniref:Uncharacterized protein n=1 Tax=Diaporthe vaccinii TaxID=105482 RepID=A0ABR4DZ45_9PEZI
MRSAHTYIRTHIFVHRVPSSLLRPYRAVPHWMGSHNPGTWCARLCGQADVVSSITASTHPHPRPLHPHHYNTLETLPSHYSTETQMLCHVGLVRVQASSFNVPSPTAQHGVAHPDARLRKSKTGSWSRYIGIARAPCGP